MVKISKASLKNKEEGNGFIDIGKYSHYGYAESPRGDKLEVFEFDNTKAGFEKFLHHLDSFKEQTELSSVKIGLESTGTYGAPLIEHLVTSGIRVVNINPKQIKRTKEIIDNSPGKSDKKDPKVGVYVMNQGNEMSMLLPTGISADLRMLIGHRDQLSTQVNRLLNQMESHVARIFPEFMVVMKGLKTKTAAYLLSKYSLPEQIVALGMEELGKELKKASCGRFGLERTGALYEAAQQSIGVQEGKAMISWAIRDLCESLFLIRKQLKKVEKQIKEVLSKHEDAEILLSLPGVGTLTAAQIIGETGGLSNYKRASQVEKLAGLNLYSLSSGTKQGRHRISKRGRGGLRQILYLAGLRMVRKNGIFRSHYDHHLSKGMKKPQAIVAIAKKLIRTMFALVKNREKFDVAKVV